MGNMCSKLGSLKAMLVQDYTPNASSRHPPVVQPTHPVTERGRRVELKTSFSMGHNFEIEGKCKGVNYELTIKLS